MRCAIYARISSDRTGAGLGIDRQIEDCTELIQKLGGVVTGIYRDNDVSAYSGKPRPGYSALLEAVRARQCDAVVAWHQDRLLRRNVDLEGYIAVCEPHAVPTYTVRAGTVDLATPSGRAVARTLAAWASYEVETSTSRVKAAKLQAARAGKPSGGQRAYGYKSNGMELEPTEQAIVLEMARRLIDGDSYRIIALDLNARGIPTAKGNQWRSINVRNVLASKRNIGIRVHNDTEYPALWPRLFDEDLWQQLVVAMSTRRALYKQRGPGRLHLLTGFTRCGKCGNTLTINAKQRRDGSYGRSFVCKSRDDAKQIIGCGGVSRNLEPVTDLITEAVLFRLDTDDLGRLIHTTAEQSATMKRALSDQGIQRERLNEIMDRYSTGQLSFDEYQQAKTIATTRLGELTACVEEMAARSTVGNLPVGQTIREAWESHNVEWRHRLLEILIDQVVILPKPDVKGYYPPKWKGWNFDISLIQVRWRV